MTRPSSRRSLNILYRDEDALVLDKPAGLASVPSRGTQGATCASEVRREFPDARPVHRLDQETSGAMVFALSDHAETALREAFESKKVEKTYWAFVHGTPHPARGDIRQRILDLGKKATVSPRGKPAHSKYRVLQDLDPASLVEVQPVTGRYNQIRLHFVAVGHPLIGERKYARGKDSPVRFRRVALHARSIAFPHPRGGRRVEVMAPLPADLQKLLESLGGDPP